MARPIVYRKINLSAEPYARHLQVLKSGRRIRRRTLQTKVRLWNKQLGSCVQAKHSKNYRRWWGLSDLQSPFYLQWSRGFLRGNVLSVHCNDCHHVIHSRVKITWGRSWWVNLRRTFPFWFPQWSTKGFLQFFYVRICCQLSNLLNTRSSHFCPSPSHEWSLAPQRSLNFPPCDFAYLLAQGSFLVCYAFWVL